MRQGSITFVGRSGEQYRFQVWALEDRFKALAAVYVVSKRAYDGGTYHRASHDNIFIGHAADLSGALGAEAPLAQFRKFGANCVCVYPVADDGRRLLIEQDLLAVYTTPCNHQARAARIFSADTTEKTEQA